MRATIHRFSLILASLGVACATGVNVRVDPEEDFSRYRVWTWLPSSVPIVDAPHGRADALEAKLSALVERELDARGFARDDEHANFYVTVSLTVQRREVSVYVPRAPYLFSSNSSAPSWWIEGSRSERRTYEDLKLAIGFADSRGRITWLATLARRLEGHTALPLEEAVAELIARSPARSPGIDAAGSREERSIQDRPRPHDPPRGREHRPQDRT